MPLDAPARKTVVVWAPNPGPQTALLACPIFEVLFGGARGGGKTDGMLGDFAAHAAAHKEHAIGLMVRRSLTQLAETIERSRAMYGPIGAKFNETEKVWRFPNGARLRFAYLERDADADNYQGHSYTRVYVEEIGTFPSPVPIFKLMATLRSGAGVPCAFRATGNPGGPGHHWVKARYIDPAPGGWKILTDPASGRERVFIPSKLKDNPYLGADYVANLKLSGSAELVRAWLEGDWTVTAGAFFPEFGPQHIIRPCELPEHWTRFVSMDWGSARPFAVHWWAVADGALPAFPRGALICYREWYGSDPRATDPNTGLRMTAEAVGDGVRARIAPGEHITYGVGDPAMFAHDGGPSIAERLKLGWLRPADNKRIGRLGALAGWDLVRHRLVGEDGRPMLYAFDTATALIRTLPALQHDDARPEDVDTDGEDHAPDSCRYACASRPWVRVPEAKEPPKFGIEHRTLDQLWELNRRSPDRMTRI